jgi:hypothetical protein
MLVYKITNMLTGAEYVGLTCRRLLTRWSDHKAKARAGTKTPLYNAMRKYGFAAFSIEAVASAKSYDALKAAEVAIIVTSGGNLAVHGGEEAR